MKSILDPTFRYTPSFDTDLRRTFERIRRDFPPETIRSTPAGEHGFAARIVNFGDAGHLRSVATGIVR